MNKNIWLLFLVFFAAYAESDEIKYFYCDFLGLVHKKTSHPNTYFNRLLRYKKVNGSSYSGNLGGHTEPLEVKWHADKNILSSVYVDSMGKEKSSAEGEFFYREKFSIYRINVKTGILIRSYVYYVSLEDYNKNFHPSLPKRNHPYAIPYSQKPLEFIEKEVPKNYVGVGFDKSKWQCREISRSKYRIESIKKFFFQIFSM